jgi:hypothetical protein
MVVGLLFVVVVKSCIKLVCLFLNEIESYAHSLKK